MPVTKNEHWVLTAKGKYSFPHILMPPFMNNKGTYTLSLGNLCRWLAGQAEALGVEIFPGFAAAEILFNEDGSVKGVATGDMGVARDGTHKPDYQPGMELHGRYTFFAEGARGHLTKELKRIFDLDAESQPQVYGIGLKEIVGHRSRKARARPGHPHPGLAARRRLGRRLPLSSGSGQVALGFVVALNYRNPWLSPFEEFQRWKQHPAIRQFLEGGRRVSYGARAINEGGWQSVPKLAFPGGALIGCAAGFVNVPRIKGSHTAMKSGMLAAEAAFAAIAAERGGDMLADYEPSAARVWIANELKMVRNVEPLVAKWGGVARHLARRRRHVDAPARHRPAVHDEASCRQ